MLPLFGFNIRLSLFLFSLFVGCFFFSHQCHANELVPMFIDKKKLSGDSIYYAKGFKIKIHSSYVLVKIQDPLAKNRMLQTYILTSRSQKNPKQFFKEQVVYIPLKRVVCFSSVLCGILDAFDVLHTVIGVTEPQYIPIPFIKKGIQDGSIQNIGLSTQPNIEKLMFLRPDAVFMHPINTDNSFSFFLKKAKIPVIYCTDYMELNPLGRAEWIRLIGLFFGKKKVADSLFLKTVQAYNNLKKSVETIRERPTVFTEMKYGDIWYMPGGKSYLAQILKDAGADYILKNDTNTGSVSLPFETVLYQAKKAKYWLIKYCGAQTITYSQLSANYSNYSLFDAYKNKNIYVCNTFERSDYFQEVFLHPDRLLKEMIALFHPGLFQVSNVSYYKKM